MMANVFTLPAIDDADIEWACKVMGLPDDAFNESRKIAIKNTSNIDVAACPGSGKTTLLVAKLAILAKKWEGRRQGVCVLSHTNVARNEIEERLGATPEGRKLLSGPHFIGTIHSFVDTFLGIPFLRMLGWKAHIDDELAYKRVAEKIWTVSGVSRDFRNKFLSLNFKNSGKYTRLEFGYDNQEFNVFPLIAENNLSTFPNGTTIESIHDFQEKIKINASASGVHTYNDLFAFGNCLIDKFPCAVEALNWRFPVVFIDEAQDNSELQSQLLDRVFNREESTSVCQRFGDANQAIYHSINADSTSCSWSFPDDNIKLDIGDSHRFGEQIAGFAKPLCFHPQELAGGGPFQKRILSDTNDKHAIFLFDENNGESVLPLYSRYLAEVFSKEELNVGSFVAVGAVHKQPQNEKNKPKSVCDYWDSYRPDLANRTTKPRFFVEYLQFGWVKSSTETHSSVESIAEAVVNACKISGGEIVTKQRKHRQLVDLLIDDDAEKQNYLEFIRRYSVDREVLTELLWNTEWKAKINDIILKISHGELKQDKLKEFLQWPQNEDGTGQDIDPKREVYYCSTEQGNAPNIKVGSIHSVKGETYTGVLVFETFNRTHQMKSLKKWLLGNSGTEKQREKVAAKLKLQYVAMTRPTHLLCLAMPDTAFSDEERQGLINLGWRVALLKEGADIEWIEADGDERG